MNPAQPSDSPQSSESQSSESQSSASQSSIDRRRAQRLSVNAHIRVHIEPCDLDGHAENLSQHDMLFLTDEDVHVTIEIEDDGVVKSTPGRLVRLEPTEEGGSGWAVEFLR